MLMAKTTTAGVAATKAAAMADPDEASAGEISLPCFPLGALRFTIVLLGDLWIAFGFLLFLLGCDTSGES